MFPLRLSLFSILAFLFVFASNLAAQIKFQDVLAGSRAAPVFSNVHINGLHVLKILDENNDGFTDFYALDCDALNLFYSNGDGSFTRLKTGIPSIPPFTSHAFIDPDGDADLDFIFFRTNVANQRDSVEVVYYQNQGNSLFKRDTLGLYPYPLTRVIPVDYDQDGDEDLLGIEIIQPIVSNSSVYTRFVAFKNNGSGAYTRIGKIGLDSIPFPQYANPNPIVDYNNDQIPDILFNSGSFFAKGTGTGIFQKQPSLWRYQFSGFSDLDQDGDVEGVVLADTNTIEIYQYHAPQDTFLITKTSHVNTAFKNNSRVRIQDWNLDGYNDLLIINSRKWNFEVLLNNGQNSFKLKEYKLAKELRLFGNTYLFPASYRGNNKIGLLYRDELYLNHTDSNTTQLVRNGILKRGVWRSLASMNVPFRHIGLFSQLTGHPFLKDFNGDNYPDIETRKLSGDSIRIGAHINLQNGQIPLRPTIFFKVHREEDVVTFDFTGDNVADVLKARKKGNHRYYTFHQNNGQGSFSRISKDSLVLPYRIFSSNSAPVDIDSDGDLDLVTVDNVNTNQEKSGILLNDGQGAFTPDTSRKFRTLQDGSFQFADFNQNGYPDLVISGDTFGFESSYTQVYFNDGSQFIPSQQKFTGLSHARITIADLDHNGALDMILTGRLNNSADGNLVYLNDSAGHFTAITPDTFGFTLNYKALVYDWDGDGINEIVQPEAQTTTVYKRDSGLHYSPVNTAGTQISRTIAEQGLAIDMDQDGKKDLLLAGEDKDYCVPITRHFRNLSKPRISIPENSRPHQKQGLSIYPNPAQNRLSIENHFTQATPVEVEIHDLSGKLKRSITLHTKPKITNTLSLTDLKAGVYIIRLKSSQQPARHFKVLKL